MEIQDPFNGENLTRGACKDFVIMIQALASKTLADLCIAQNLEVLNLDKFGGRKDGTPIPIRQVNFQERKLTAKERSERNLKNRIFNSLTVEADEYLPDDNEDEAECSQRRSR